MPVRHGTRATYDVANRVQPESRTVALWTVRQPAAAATRDDIDAILDALAAVGIPVIPNFSWRPELSDPGDEMALESAVNGRADFIATFNVMHLGQGVGRFGVRAIRPPEAFSILEGLSS